MNELFEAVKKGDAEVVKSLLATGALVDAVNQYGSTPLHWAAKNGYESVVQVLLATGALVDAVNQYGYTPLHWAAKNGYEAVVQALLAGGADPNIRGFKVYTPLHWAAKNGYEAVVDLLLEAGADIKLLKKDSVERELCQNILNGLLRSAVISNNIVKVQVYIAIGAGVNATDDDGAMPLHQAAGVGYTAAVKALVKAGAEVNAVSQNRETPLHLAAKNGHAAIVNVLVQAGADINAASKAGYTPLHLAAARGHAAIVNVLVRAGALVDAVSQNRETPLHLAAKNGYESVVQVLLATGALVDAVNQYGYTPLHWAAKNGYEAVVQALLAGGADPNIRGFKVYTPLHWAAYFGHLEVVTALLDKDGTEVDAKDQNGETPLHRAAKNGNEAVVDLLLEAGADIKLLKKDSVEKELCQNILNGLLRSAVISNNIVKVQAYIAIGAGVNATDDDGETPLHLAAKNGCEAVVRLLLAAGALVDAVDPWGRSALIFAAENGYEAVVQVLLAGGADPNIRGFKVYTPLHWAAYFGHLEVVTALLDKDGTEVDAKDQNGETPLHLAAKNGNEAVVDLLLEAGADIKLLKKDSVEKELCQNILNGLLRSAVISNNIVKVQAYIAIGAGVNATDGDGAMPLHWAASRGHAAIVNVLVRAGALVDAVSQNRETPLHLAAKNGYESVVQVLLATGALVDAVNQYGYTPLHWAAKNGYEAVVQALLAAGAKVNAVDKQGYTPLRIARDGPTYDAIKAYIDSKQHQWRRHLQALRSSALHQQKTSNFHLVELFPDNIKRKFIASFFERLSPLLAFSKILNPRLAEGNKENSSPAASVALDIFELIAGFIEPRIPTLLNVISRSLKDHPEVLEVYAKVLESLNQLQSYINTHTGKKERQKAALDIQEKLLALTESRKIFNSENVLEEIIANLTEESYAEVFKTHSVNKVISFFPLAGGCELAYTKLEGVLASIQKIFSPDSVGINFNKLKDSLQAQAQPEPEVAAAQPEPVASPEPEASQPEPEAVASPEPEPKEAEAGRPAATTTFFVAAAAAVGAAGSASPEPDGTELKVVC